MAVIVEWTEPCKCISRKKRLGTYRFNKQVNSDAARGRGEAGVSNEAASYAPLGWRRYDC